MFGTTILRGNCESKIPRNCIFQNRTLFIRFQNIQFSFSGIFVRYWRNGILNFYFALRPPAASLCWREEGEGRDWAEENWNSSYLMYRVSDDSNLQRLTAHFTCRLSDHAAETTNLSSGELKRVLRTMWPRFAAFIEMVKIYCWVFIFKPFFIYRCIRKFEEGDAIVHLWRNIETMYIPCSWLFKW